MAKCKECGQPMLPPGAVKRPNEYDHAQGCPLAPALERTLAERIVAELIVEIHKRHGLRLDVPAPLVEAIERVLAEDLKGLLERADRLIKAIEGDGHCPSDEYAHRCPICVAAQGLREALRKFRERRSGE